MLMQTHVLNMSHVKTVKNRRDRIPVTGLWMLNASAGNLFQLKTNFLLMKLLRDVTENSDVPPTLSVFKCTSLCNAWSHHHNNSGHKTPRTVHWSVQSTTVTFNSRFFIIFWPIVQLHEFWDCLKYFLGMRPGKINMISSFLGKTILKSVLTPAQPYLQPKIRPNLLQVSTLNHAACQSVSPAPPPCANH